MKPSYPTQSLNPVRFFAGVLAAYGIALGLFYILMRPSFKDFALMMALMGGTALVSVLAVYAAYRLGWIHRFPGIRWTMLSSYALASLLVFLNIWFTARMMFASLHDLMLASVLLVFAGGIAMSAGYILSATIIDRIQILNLAAGKIAMGHLDTRVSERGYDEMSGLAKSFNEMARQLQAGEQKQRELDTLRADLIAWIGHDLRTPLTSIRAILEALADGVVEDPETIQRYLGTAQRDIRDLSNLIDDLFEMAQMDAGGLHLDRQTNALSDLISDTIESFSQIAQRQQVTLTGNIAAGTDPVYMDAQQIGRVLNNLVSNAIRHTPAGGQVIIRAFRDSSNVIVEVEDNGEGIRQEDLPNVFERFFRGEKSRNRTTGGAGLGLAIARGIVEAHKGSITVSSQMERGTCFRFLLPVSPIDGTGH